MQLPVATFFWGGKRGEKKDSLLLGLNVSFQKLVGVKSLTFFFLMFSLLELSCETFPLPQESKDTVAACI